MEYDAYFQYPIDTAKLLAKKNRIKRALDEQLKNPICIKVAILGGSTTNEVAEQLNLFLLFYGIRAEFYQSEYNQYWEDAMFGNPQLDNFAPDVIYVHTNWRNIAQFPGITDSEEQINEMLAAECSRMEQMWIALGKKFPCPIIQNNMERPNYRLMGNRDIWDPHGRSNYISRINQFIYQYATQHKDFYVNDIDYLSAEYGLAKWTDVFCWHMYKYAMHLNAIPLLANSVANIIKSLYGRNKKALVLDLDNTLWGGVVGDDGVEGIAIGPEVPEGQVYAEFQSYCKALKTLGIVLAVNSKNEEANALAGLNHPDGILKPEDFVAIKANWQPKDRNILEIASELTLGADSFVFVDDNPAEQEIVRQGVNGITVPAVTGVEGFIEAIDHSGCFETTIISAEDLQKTELYKAKEQREQLAKSFADYDAYLQSLQMTAAIESFQDAALVRIAQLTNKSNQFNLTTKRCSEDDIRHMKQAENYITVQGRLKDKFGDNGIVSVVSGEIVGSQLHIRLWLMSCRVLKRGMENAMMDKVVAEAKRRGLTQIVGYYYPTAKNAMVKLFYKDFGFAKSDLSNADCDIWELTTDNYTTVKSHITVLDEEK